MSITKMKYVSELLENKFDELVRDTYHHTFKELGQYGNGAIYVRCLYEYFDLQYETDIGLETIFGKDVITLDDILLKLGELDHYRKHYVELKPVFNPQDGCTMFTIDSLQKQLLDISTEYQNGKSIIIDDSIAYIPDTSSILATLDVFNICHFVIGNGTGHFTIGTKYFSFKGTVNVDGEKYLIDVTEINGVNMPNSFNFDSIIYNESFKDSWTQSIIRQFKTYQMLSKIK